MTNRKISINFKNENVYGLSIHDSSSDFLEQNIKHNTELDTDTLHSYDYVLLGKNKIYKLKEISRTVRNKVTFNVVDTIILVPTKKKNRKTITKWITDKNLYSREYYESTSSDVVRIGKTNLLKNKPSEDDKLFVPKVKKYVFPKWVDNILLDVICDNNILLTGQSGTGKTTVIQQIAARLDMPVYRVQCSASMQVESLIGGYAPSSAGGANWIDGMVTDACRKGYWIILDEFDAAPSSIKTILNGLLEVGNRSLVLTDKDGGETLTLGNGKIHPTFRAFSTGNTIGAMQDHAEFFGGMNDNNVAQNQRFNIYLIQPLNNVELFKAVKNEIPELSHQSCRKIIKLAEAINDANIPGVFFSTRVAIAVAGKIRHGFTLEDALEPTFLNHFGSSETNRIKKIIQSIGKAK